MTENINLPELPVPSALGVELGVESDPFGNPEAIYGYLVDDLLDYARAAVIADRAQVCNLLNEVRLLCEWIAETPHQRGSINGMASQVLHKITQELADRAQRQAVPQGWITELLATAEEGYEAAAQVSGSALLAGETPKAKQAEQRRLVYENACRALGSLYCVVDELRKQLSASPTPPASEPVQDAASVEELIELADRLDGYLTSPEQVELGEDIRAYAQRLKEGK